MFNFENKNAEQFADACVSTNTIEDLLDGLESEKADRADCETWEVSEAEWCEVMRAAAAEKIRIWAAENESSELLAAIADWDNSPLETVEIDGAGDIYSGSRWLDEDKLIEFYRWHAETYGL